MKIKENWEVDIKITETAREIGYWILDAGYQIPDTRCDTRMELMIIISRI